MVPLRTKQAIIDDEGELTIGDTVVAETHSINDDNVKEDQEPNTMNTSPLKRKPGSVENVEYKKFNQTAK